MVYELKDATEFVGVPFTSPREELAMYKLAVGLDTYPLNGSSWSTNPPTIINPTTNKLKVHGHQLSDTELKQLIQKLKKESLLVNQDGACYVKTYKLDQNGQVVRVGNQPQPPMYLRLADVFPWPDFGVKNFKFSGFGTSKYLTSGTNVDPSNLAVANNNTNNNNNNNNNQIVDGLKNQIASLNNDLRSARTTSDTLQETIDKMKDDLIRSFTTAAANNARPLSPGAFSITYADLQYQSQVAVDDSWYGKELLKRPELVDAGSSSSFPSTGELKLLAQGDFDTTSWWVVGFRRNWGAIQKLAYYDGSLGFLPYDPYTTVPTPWPTGNPSAGGTCALVIVPNIGVKYAIAF